MQKVNYIIHANKIVTMNDNMDVIDNGAIAVKGNKIVALGKKTEIMQHYHADNVIDKTGHVVMPGLINTHTHSAMVYMRGIADDLPLKTWLEEHIWPIEAKWLSPQFVYDATKLACLEMLLSGTTTFADLYFYCDEVAKATAEMGLRSVVAYNIFDLPSAVAKTQDEYFKITESFIKNWQNHELITPAVGPHSPYACSTETLKRSQKLAEKYNTLIVTHIAETKVEQNDIIQKYGTTPVKYLNNIGLLDHKVLGAHCVWIDDEEIKILADKKVGVSHCIDSNLKLASGFAPIVKMLEQNVCISYGTDGAAGSNNDLDLLQEVSTSAKLHKILADNPKALNAKTALTMATKGGAKAVGMENKIGQFSEGFLADIIAIDTSKPHMNPCYDVYSQIIYATKSSDVNMVMVNGKMLFNDSSKYAPTLLNHANSNIFHDIMSTAQKWQNKIVPFA